MRKTLAWSVRDIKFFAKVMVAYVCYPLESQEDSKIRSSNAKVVERVVDRALVVLQSGKGLQGEDASTVDFELLDSEADICSEGMSACFREFCEDEDEFMAVTGVRRYGFRVHDLLVFEGRLRSSSGV